MVEQVQVPHSVVEGKAPSPDEVIVGGLALNLKDPALYSKGYDGKVIRLTGVVAIETDQDTNADVYLPWVKGAGAGVQQYISGSKLSFNPSTGHLRATHVSGNGSGLTDFTAGQIRDALGFNPAKRSDTVLPPPATDLPTALTLLNSIRAVLISVGIGTN